MNETSFPRQQARTHRFALGVPRDFVIAPDGRRVLFLRTRSGTDPSTCLWQFDLDSGTERLIVDPAALAQVDVDEVPAEERMRRERARESSGGIVRFSANRDVTRVAFDLAGRIYVVDVASGAATELAASGRAIDPRVDPTGARIAYVEAGALHVSRTDGDEPRVLKSPENDDVTYGLAEFVAAEEMSRQSGYWWSPDGSRVLAARVDVARVRRWFIADPANPDRPPVAVAYPAAGTDNADVTLHIVAVDGSGSVEVDWDRVAFEYVTTVDWSEHGLLVVVQSRDQRTMRILEVETSTGTTSVVREDIDDAWVDIVTGVPATLPDGTLVWTADRDGAKRLLIGDEPVTSPELEVRDVLDVDGDVVIFRASRIPTEVGVYTWSRADGVAQFQPEGIPPGVWRARTSGGTTVLSSQDLDHPGVRVTVHRDGRNVRTIESVAETPVIGVNVRLATLGDRGLRAALVLPNGHQPGSRKLPVLLDPYGGPGAQKVTASASGYLESQWFADQGFAVLVIDGRGTPGGGPQWARSIRGDYAAPVLEDQVDGLVAAAAEWPDLDLARVAIRGWSFGGFLAALAVLRRPDVFNVAVAGAPVTDDHLYDTHYTERYLGHPDVEPANYAAVSLVADAARLTRPLMLIHGLSDDNVVVAHTLRFSGALLAAGREHTVLPLSGATHMASDETIAENLLLLALEFIRRAIG
ncbi:MAG: DPP IV N-terminal domain-containing protein [Candidatus Dormiibacterota bacterium]